MSKKLNLNKKKLKYLYINKKLSMEEISKKIDTCSRTIFNYLIKYNIPTRKRGFNAFQRIGRKNPNWRGGKSSRKFYCKFCKNQISYQNYYYGKRQCQKCYLKNRVPLKGKNHPCYGKKFGIDTRRKVGLASKKHWQDPKYVKKVTKARMKALNVKPNQPEKKLDNYLQNWFPKEYKYVGNFKFQIERYNPDFININGQKKIIELYGDYWHNLPDYKERDKRRIKIYRKYGYKTLIIWQKELKNISKLKNKIISFHKVV